MCSASAVQHPRGTSEYDFAGGLRGAAVEVVKCETLDLSVPARAEIVVEGWISTDPKDFMMEGPFGEYPGTVMRMLNGPFPTGLMLKWAISSFFIHVSVRCLIRVFL